MEAASKQRLSRQLWQQSFWEAACGSILVSAKWWSKVKLPWNCRITLLWAQLFRCSYGGTTDEQSSVNFDCVGGGSKNWQPCHALCATESTPAAVKGLKVLLKAPVVSGPLKPLHMLSKEGGCWDKHLLVSWHWRKGFVICSWIVLMLTTEFLFTSWRPSINKVLWMENCLWWWTHSAYLSVTNQPVYLCSNCAWLVFGWGDTHHWSRDKSQGSWPRAAVSVHSCVLGM